MWCRATGFSVAPPSWPPLTDTYPLAPWLQPLAYGDDYAELGPFLRSLVPAGAAAVGATASASSLIRSAQPPSLDLTGYRQAMARHNGHLKLEELDATSSDMPRGIRVTEQRSIR